MNSVESILEKGHYLAPISKTVQLQGLLVGMTKYPDPVETGRWHAHKNPMISFVMEGGNIENRKGQQFHRGCGSINFYHAFELHQNIYRKFPSKHYSLEIDESFLEKYELAEGQVHLAVKQNPFSKFLFLKTLKEVTMNDSFSEDSIEMLFLELIQNTPAAKSKGPFPDWVPVLREILNDNWNRQLSLQELSDKVGIHPVTISGSFRKYFCCTFGEYMRKMKIDRALYLIRNTKQPLTQVAYICGFADQSHFTRTFKQLTGFLPKDFLKL